MDFDPNLLVIQQEVKEALRTGAAIVALESTIIAHGMPYPQNYETASLLESIIRKKGAIPATIAILGGKIHIGLDQEQLLYLSQATQVVKASRRDLAFVISQRMDAATTVASTMICASMAGIRIFATGGIGGVHRDAQQSMDISADLQEFKKSPVAVVSAGAKAILDLELTLEYLETMGIAVIGYQCDEFPAFYSRNSGIKIPMRLDSPEEIASVLFYQSTLGLSQGSLIANPVPSAFSMPSQLIQPAIEQALTEAANRGIRGKSLTPFLLKRIATLTDGKSLFSNIELVKNNVALAADIALALSEKERAT